MSHMAEFDPAPGLGDVVLRSVDYHERGPAASGRAEMPVLAAVVIVSLGPDFEVDGERVGSFAAGLWDRPVITGHFGEQAGYELWLEPLAARRLLGVPMAELTNRLVDLDDLLGAFASELAERLAAEQTPEARHALAQRLLAGRLADSEPAAPEIGYALGRIRASHGSSRVETIARETGWSRRHLASRFHEHVGLAPKAVARLARAQRAVGLLRSGEPLADVAYAAGYSDQPHLNRDFRDLVGCTPGEFPFVQDALSAA